MSKRAFFVLVVVMFSFGLSTAYGLDAGNEKVGALQKIKNAYNDFKNKQQQKSQVVKNEALKQPQAPKVAVSKIESPKVESSQAAAHKAQPKDKEMTKEEMLSELKEELADNDEVFDAVPGLKVGTDQNGNAVYTYKNTALDELSKEDLANLYGKVGQAIASIRTDRIQKQLEVIRQVERLQKMTNPPQPPRTFTTPPSPPSTSRTPPAPPPVPQRR